MKKFEDIFRIYSEEVPARSEDEGHKPNQVREKYAEIIEIVGLDNRLYVLITEMKLYSR